MVATGELTADQDRRRRLRFDLRSIGDVRSRDPISITTRMVTYAMERPEQLIACLVPLGYIGFNWNSFGSVAVCLR